MGDRVRDSRGRGTKGRGSILRACENAVELSMCDGHMETIFIKR